MRRMLVPSLCLVAAGCGTPGPESSALPATSTPCAKRSSTPTPRPTPTETRVPYRVEEMTDGSVRMTVGDVDAAPKEPSAKRVLDYRSPADTSDCDTVRIKKVRGWWCVTTAKKPVVSGEIVVGGAKPRAKIQSDGFTTRCSKRPGRMRQEYVIQRDSWDRWRSYGETHTTRWTTDQQQHGRRVSEICPRGRVGSYNYRLSVRMESDQVPVGEAWAASARIRTDCGTGIS